MRFREAGIVNVALAVSGGIEINAINDALEQRVGIGDGAELRGELLADLVRERADDGPDGGVGVLRFERQKKANEFLVVLHQLERLGTRADLFGDAVQLIIERITKALCENEREDIILELGSILRAQN